MRENKTADMLKQYPAPWRVDLEDYGWIIRDAEGQEIVSQIESEAVADMMVAAVNHHEKIIADHKENYQEALKRIEIQEEHIRDLNYKLYDSQRYAHELYEITEANRRDEIIGSIEGEEEAQANRRTVLRLGERIVELENIVKDLKKEKQNDNRNQVRTHQANQ